MHCCNFLTKIIVEPSGTKSWDPMDDDAWINTTVTGNAKSQALSDASPAKLQCVADVQDGPQSILMEYLTEYQWCPLAKA